MTTKDLNYSIYICTGLICIALGRADIGLGIFALVIIAKIFNQ